MASPGAPVPASRPASLAAARARAAGVVSAAPRLALTQAARLRRPVAITTKLFTLAAICLGTGAVAAGAGILIALGTGGVIGPAIVVVAALLYVVPLFLVLSCRKALASYPRFLDVLEHDALAFVAAPAPDAATIVAERRRRAPVRVLHATRRLLRGAAVPVRAAAEAAGVWRLASPVVSIGGAIAFVATPALLLLGLVILAAGIVLA